MIFLSEKKTSIFSFIDPALRKIISIALLICFAIYHFGYYGFYFSATYSLESSWKDKIYSEQLGSLEERMMEIPLSAPYMANQDDFQATNTRFEKDGKYFRAIKQRYQNDTLQIVYVPDTSRRVLETSVKKWISSLVDDELPQDQNGKSMIKLFAKDYVESDLYSLPIAERSGYEIQIGFIFSAYMSPYFNLDSPPPQIS
ncbi:hypothetical protein Ataiwa_00390 [Algoriphagus taiwanensis]|uniref:Uncharacterized protein n=1 Tax=Algoriphagus taiwanensis TaxID=1445656 RepID=A0ABQ6PW16_9BACT|nr:hypothetical protein Ataiwa_00390 [Algoriphagus taiwanensis]